MRGFWEGPAEAGRATTCTGSEVRREEGGVVQTSVKEAPGAPAKGTLVPHSHWLEASLGGTALGCDGF